MSNLALKQRNTLELKKHVNAIHCSNNLTLVQRKLFNALLFNAYPALPHKQKFEIRSKDLCSLIGYNSKDIGKLKNALLGLITIAIEWNVIDCSTGQEKKWKASSILASAELSAGVCMYEYSQVMKDFLYQPEVYGRVNIELMSRFKSSYGLALYENCIRYNGIAQTPWFTLEVFRKLMGVFGDKYPSFKDFKKRVVDIAVTEVNSVSPLAIIPEIERVNQKVTKIRFKLAKNTNILDVANVAGVATEKDDGAALIVSLREVFGLSQQLLDEVCSKYDQKYIQEKVNLILSSDSFVSGKIRGLSGYLIEALKKDYQVSKSSKTVINEKRKEKEILDAERKRKEESRAERYNLYVSKKINTYFASLTNEENSLLLTEFELYVKSQNSVLRGWYKKHGLDHPAVKSSLNQFIRENKKNALGEILSSEDFISLIDESNQ